MFRSVDGGCSRICVSTRQGACRQRFLVLMVGTPGSIALARPSEPTADVFYVDGACSRISVSTRQGAYRRRFLALMVDTPRSTTSTLPRDPAVDVS
jgi:hypothetical protein